MHDFYGKKIDRVTAILTQLQSKNLVRAQDLANKFNVSLRTIYRDIKTLENAGIPVSGEAGSGYSMMEGYKLPPVMFTRDEVLSFITAEKLMQNFSHESLGQHYHSAMEKVRSVLRFSDRNLIENIENKIDIYSHNPPKTESLKNIIPTILQSIADKLQVEIHYKDVSGESSTRTIEAVGVFYEFNFWYVLAFCKLRQDFRQFRVDRIIQVKTTENACRAEYGHINEYRNSSKKEKTTVKILVEEDVLPHIINSKKYYGWIDEEKTEKGTLMTFETEWIEEGFPRWYLTFADCATIIEPEILETNLKKLLHDIENHLKKN